MMGETFKYVAPVAGALGFSAEDTALAIGLMANSGIKAGQAGTSLRAILSRMAKPTKEVQGAMDALNISLTNSDGSMKSLNEIMGDLRNGFAGLSEAEQAEMASALGGQEAMSGLLAIVNASDSDFEKLESAIYSCDGAAAQMADTMNDNLKGRLTTLKSSLEGLGLELYESMEKPLTGLAEVGINEINKLTEAFQKDGASGLITAGSEIVAELVTGMIEQSPKIIPKIIDAGIALLKGLVQGLINSLPLLISEGPRLINDFAEAIYSGLGKLILTGLEMLMSLIKGLWDNKGLLLENAGAILLAFINVFSLSKLLSLGKSLMSSMAKGIKGMLPNMASAGKEILTYLVNGIKALATHPVTAIQGIITNIKSAFTSINWGSIGSNIVSGIARGLTSAAGAIVTAAKNAAKKALDSAKSFLGIHSPSTVFRDQVGKYMALGIGVGFEKNIPVEDMKDSISDSVEKIKKASYHVTSSVPPTTNNVLNKTEIVYDNKLESSDNPKSKEIIIHTHVDLDGKEVGNSITKYVDQNMSDDEDLRRRGN